jgi:hypothetical protein
VAAAIEPPKATRSESEPVIPTHSVSPLDRATTETPEQVLNKKQRKNQKRKERKKQLKAGDPLPGVPSVRAATTPAADPPIVAPVPVHHQPIVSTDPIISTALPVSSQPQPASSSRLESNPPAAARLRKLVTIGLVFTSIYYLR